MSNAKIFLAPALAAAMLLPLAASRATAQPAPSPSISPSALGVPTPVAVPTIAPSAIPTLPPASSSLTLPYPAVGTPAPGVTASAVNPAVPQTVTLKQAILIAVAKSPLLASARGDLQLARASVNLAQAGTLPNVSANASTSHSHAQPGSRGNNNNGNGNNGGTFISSTQFTSNNLSANLSQLLFDGGRVFAQIRSASASQVSSIDLYQRTLQTVAFNVASAYYTALSAQRTTAVDNQIVGQDQVQLNLVIAQFHAGQASRVDVATAELPVSQARVALVQQQGVEAGAQAALANAMGIDANTVVRPADDAASYQDVVATAIAIPTYDKAIAQAYLLRPDLASASQTVQAAQYSLRAARLGYFPTVNGTSSYGLSSNDTAGGAFSNSWSIGANLTLPIFDPALRANVESAQGNVTKAIAAYQTSQLGVQLNVKQTLTSLISTRAALDATQVAYNEAATVLQATQAQYRAGVTTLPLLLNAQVQLTTALVNEVNAIYSLRQAEQAFLYATGQNI
ncbi:MAG: TolC family protein [Vulcanimicrobiaceae bacterium]